jgi:hypothetical protein
MNAIALFLMLVLDGNSTCQSELLNDRVYDGQAYRVQVFHCYWAGTENPPSRSFEVWSPICDSYVAEPILVREPKQRKGWTMNQFGEFYPATVDIERMHVYRPRCG